MGISPAVSGRKALFLDRDGVLHPPLIRNGRPNPPQSLADVVITDGAAAALGSLKQAGFLLLVVSNQPDVGRGTATRGSVDEINGLLSQSLPVDDFFVCYHDDADDCHCRKPKPGLLLDAAVRYGIDLSASYMVGDRWRDIEAGSAAGCHTVLIQFNYSERGPSSVPNAVVKSLGEAATWILSHAPTAG